MLCKDHSTCGSGVQPTTPGNDIHTTLYKFHSALYTLPKVGHFELGQNSLAF